MTKPKLKNSNQDQSKKNQILFELKTQIVKKAQNSSSEKKKK